MTLTIARIGKNPTVKYASEELARLIRIMDGEVILDIRLYNERTDKEGVIWVGLDGSVPESKYDDTVNIDVTNGDGIITGSNPRSVLMAAYRFMYELGCRFLRPGKAGELVPQRKLSKEDFTVKVNETASYRHRCICFDGACKYDQVVNMIDWLPKVGMNGYFVQLMTPAVFFNRYALVKNPYMPKQLVNDDDVDHIRMAFEEEIILRGLDYHAVGHGWNNEALGIHSSSWVDYDGEVPADKKQYLAEINGKRELFGGKPLNTNLCFSNPEARTAVANTVADYCKAHPAVTHLHVWLADDKNNHCECEECRKMRPSDFYVMMLNEVDEKLTAEGIDTKIVCLLYLDLLWAPEVQKIKNQDRFVLMFAPMTRTYTHALADYDRSKPVELAPYERNKLIMPTTVAENVEYLRIWQNEQIKNDSFDYDYHLMWDHYNDPGYFSCARILHADCTGLDKIGLRGMVSCQSNRCAFPTGLPMYAMARGLWDKNSTFDAVTDEYFTSAFGEDGETVKNYLAKISELFCPTYMRREKPFAKEKMIENVIEAKKVVNSFDAEYIKARANLSEDWKHLEYHADIVRIYADVVLAGLRCDEEQVKVFTQAMYDYMFRVEKDIGDYFDDITYRRGYERYIPKTGEPL